MISEKVYRKNFWIFDFQKWSTELNEPSNSTDEFAHHGVGIAGEVDYSYWRISSTC